MSAPKSLFFQISRAWPKFLPPDIRRDVCVDVRRISSPKVTLWAPFSLLTLEDFSLLAFFPSFCHSLILPHASSNEMGLKDAQRCGLKIVTSAMLVFRKKINPCLPCSGISLPGEPVSKLKQQNQVQIHKTQGFFRLQAGALSPPLQALVAFLS